MSADFGENSVKKHRHRLALHARDQTDCSSTLMHASADPVRLSLAECILLYRFINAEKKSKDSVWTTRIQVPCKRPCSMMAGSIVSGANLASSRSICARPWSSHQFGSRYIDFSHLQSRSLIVLIGNFACRGYDSRDGGVHEGNSARWKSWICNEGPGKELQRHQPQTLKRSFQFSTSTDCWESQTGKQTSTTKVGGHRVSVHLSKTTDARSAKLSQTHPP